MPSSTAESTAMIHQTVLYDSPIGPLGIVACGESLAAIEIHPNSLEEKLAKTSPIHQRAIKVLDLFFTRKFDAFEAELAKLPLAITSGTDFQQEVWRTLTTIPRGETRTYGWVAASVKRPLASRAVGQANRANPLPILVPCHRVVPSSGGLGGYMGSNIAASQNVQIKAWLLEFEKKLSEEG